MKSKLMVFVDTRLHISIRPSLEYKLPEAARAVKGALVGDHNSDAAIAALEVCLQDLDLETHTSQERSDANDLHSTEIELRRMCAAVCTQLDEYLRHLSGEWSRHLAQVWSHVHRHIDRLHKELQYAKSVCARYTQINRNLVEREFRNEVLRLEEHLETTVREVRERPEPCGERPTALITECAALKTAFPEAYGSIPTQRLLLVKTEFERNVTSLEAAVAQDFVARVKRYVLPTASH